MKYHCGLLDERPENSRTLNWIKRPNWGHRPPEIEHELQVWLAMPGFSVSYHAHTLRHAKQVLTRHMGGYEEHKAEVIENWLSATREDCIKLARLRPGKGDVPVISQIRAVEDLKTMGLKAVSEDYGVSLHSVQMWRKSGFRFNGPMPSGFELLIRS